MMKKSVWAVVIAAAVAMMPLALIGQVDPTMSANPTPMNPQSPQNQNQSLNAPGNPTQTGSQASQPNSMRDSLGAPGETGQQMLDKKFLHMAAQNGIADVKIGMLAVERGGPEVKSLGQKLVDDHSEINKEMAMIADTVGVSIPKKMTKEDDAEFEKLNGLSGKDFDAEYLAYTAKSHYQDLHSFHLEASAAADPDLATVVVKSMKTMHDHLGLIAKTAADEGITLPPRPPRPVQPDSTTAKK